MFKEELEKRLVEFRKLCKGYCSIKVEITYNNPTIGEPTTEFEIAYYGSINDEGIGYRTWGSEAQTFEEALENWKREVGLLEKSSQ